MDWPNIVSEQRLEAMVDTAASSGKTISPVSAHTKSDWVEMSAATSFKYQAVMAAVRGYTPTALDIAMGPTSSEQIIVPDLYFGCSTQSKIAAIILPIEIPAGVRLAARVQQISTTYASFVSLHGIGGAYGQSFSRIDAYGFNPATTRGVSIDPGTTIHTKGAWIEITAGISRHAKALILAFGNQNISYAWEQWLIDVGIGSSGNETVIIPNIYICATDISDNLSPAFCGPFLIPLSAGSRIAMRAQCNATADRLLNGIIYVLS